MPHVQVADLKTLGQFERLGHQLETLVVVLEHVEHLSHADVDEQLQTDVSYTARHLQRQFVVLDGLAEVGVGDVDVSQTEVDLAGGARLVTLAVQRVSAVLQRAVQAAHPLVAARQVEVGLGSQQVVLHAVRDVQLLESQLHQLPVGHRTARQ